MDYHHNARLTIIGREELAISVVEGRLSLREPARKLRAADAGGCRHCAHIHFQRQRNLA